MNDPSVDREGALQVLVERRRRAVVAVTGTMTITLLGFVTALVCNEIVVEAAGLRSRGTRDGWYAPMTFAFIGASLVLGVPGRSPHNHQTWSVVRRGLPRWWKGAVSLLLAASIVWVALEALTIPTLEARSPAWWDAPALSKTDAIRMVRTITMGNAGVQIAWFAVGSLLRPQLFLPELRGRAYRSSTALVFTRGDPRARHVR